MRLHRFYIERTLGLEEVIKLSDAPLAHQLKNVFRMGVGDRLILLDDSGSEFEAVLESVSRNELVVRVNSVGKKITEPKKNIHLICSLIKKDRFEWLLEKGTEIGVSHFLPVISSRSENKNFNEERAKKIIKEASEQSGRGRLPIVYPIDSLESVLLKYKTVPLCALHMGGELFSKDVVKIQELGILIGPEGGWGEKDLELFAKYSIPHYSLGTQILRAETAALAASVIALI